MRKKDANELLRKYRAGACSGNEKALLEQWYQQLDNGASGPDAEELRSAKDRTWEDLVRSQKKVKALRSWYRYAAAVLALTIISAGAWLLIKETPQPVAEHIEVSSPTEQDARPGGNKAILSLADGTQISLSDAGNGAVAEDQGVTIRKTADGQIRYESSPARDGEYTNSATGKFNKITTPPGGQYHVVLPDGTQVWLNAASSLKYPLTFADHTRSVELTGEAYFEVNGMLSHTGTRVPFIVATSRQTVEVLGTRFNINSYEDEGVIRTTLVEGSVRVSALSSGADGLLLKPDQQSVLTGDALRVREVNADDVAAWKDGYFTFDRADLKTVMRQLSRWYDLEVAYEGKIPSSIFSGKVDRNMNLSNVLEVLAFSHVKFRIEDRTIIIFS